MAPNRAGRIFVPTNPDLVDLLGRTDLNFDIFYFFDLLDPKILNFRSPNLKKSGFPGPQISQIPQIPDFQISRFPDFQTPPPAVAEELSDPNLTALPTHPGIKYVARALAAILPKTS